MRIIKKICFRTEKTINIVLQPDFNNPSFLYQETFVVMKYFLIMQRTCHAGDKGRVYFAMNLTLVAMSATIVFVDHLLNLHTEQ